MPRGDWYETAFALKREGFGPTEIARRVGLKSFRRVRLVVNGGLEEYRRKQNETYHREKREGKR